MRKLLKAALAALAAFSVVMCADPVEPEQDTEPDTSGRTWEALLEARVLGKTIRTFNFIPTGKNIVLSDTTTVFASDRYFPIDNCTLTPHKKVSVDFSTGRWCIDGEDSGIYYDSSIRDADSEVVYAYYDSEKLHLLLSNGGELTLDIVKEDPSTDPEEEKDTPPYPGEGEDYSKEYSIPTIYITTEGGATIDSKTRYVKGHIKVEDPRGYYSDVTVLESDLQIKGRGNTTWSWDKKPYRIKLDEAQKVLGIKRNKDWVLLANYADKSLLRNTVGFEISRVCQMSWTPAVRSVVFYLNGEYQGVYCFTEHKEVANHRVDIADDDYYLEIEQFPDEPYTFWTKKYDVPIMFHQPEYPTDEQYNEVKDFINGFENVLNTAKAFDLEEGYPSYINVDSFVNYFIVEELTKNIDGNLRKSTFITKEKDKPMELYHVWDFDLALGNCNYMDSEFYPATNGPTGWFIKEYGRKGKGTGWYPRLFQDPAFVQKVKDRWNEVYPRLFKIPDFIDVEVRKMDNEQYSNFQKWKVLGTYLWPNYKVLGTYQEEVDYLKEFYTTRLEWLDENINAL